MPVLIPAQHGDLDSLLRAMDALDDARTHVSRRSHPRPHPLRIHDAIERYAELRRRRPDAEILMGTGNLTELTDADTTGINAVLMGIVSELRITQRARRAGEPALPPRRAGDRCRAPA